MTLTGDLHHLKMHEQEYAQGFFNLKSCDYIALYFADASASQSADGPRCFKHGLVVAPRPFANCPAEACPK